MTPDTKRYLTTVKYIPEKKLICAGFLSKGARSTEKFAFFPSLLLPSTPFTEAQLSELLSENSIKSKIFAHENSIEIMAPTFNDLKKIRNIIKPLINSNLLLLEPERQFLIMKGWGYFDSFAPDSESGFRKQQISLPKTELDFLPYAFDELLQDAVVSENSVACNLSRRIVRSNILKIPPQKIPEDNFSLLETLLENILFKHRFAFIKRTDSIREERQKAPYGKFSEITEFDFSPVLTTLFTMPFFNFGADSLDCKCCRPKHFSERNVLPNSMVELEFKEDGIYFEPFSNNFSEKFHEENNCKEQRLKQKSEFYLRQIPAGPFFRGERHYILLPDAITLVNEGKAVFTGTEKLHWFCTKKESFLSDEITNMQRELVAVSRQVNENENACFKNHGISAMLILESNAEHFYLSTHKKELENLLNMLPPHFMERRSNFYSPELADALLSIQDHVISRFLQFASGNGGRFIHSEKCSVFMESEFPLHLAMEFSTKENFPMPQIAKNHGILAFR